MKTFLVIKYFKNRFQADVCVLLLQHGASARTENSDGKTPQDLADGDAKAVFTGSNCCVLQPN